MMKERFLVYTSIWIEALRPGGCPDIIDGQPYIRTENTDLSELKAYIIISLL
ncbi:PIN domain nuclease [Thermosediminibacter litoriperuensis]|uniref:PIN domain nuclease n=1 Tax=Thermosediminibacter litoriperuensis TaxID=291989 RepID=UPI0011E60B53|nr:PIN domain nuclease [Thermosediminibacter litoriperuensis]